MTCVTSSTKAVNSLFFGQIFFGCRISQFFLRTPSLRRWGDAVFKITAISHHFFFSIGQKSPWIKGSSQSSHRGFTLTFGRVFPIFFGSAYIGSGVGAENVPTPPGGCPPSTALPTGVHEPSTSRLRRVSNMRSLFVVCVLVTCNIQHTDSIRHEFDTNTCSSNKNRTESKENFTQNISNRQPTYLT